jgi:hypothetical protein
MRAMRKAAAIVAVVSLVAGCGGGGGKSHTTTTTGTAAKKPPAKPSRPQYVPSAHHAHRPRGFVYNDEIGENVLTAPYDRIVQLFGPPSRRHGNCIEYKIVERPSDHWTFCFKGQRMISASG